MTTDGIGSAVAFIVGSPRSGTTILSEVLDRHPEIAQWYEPYFVWAFHLDLKDTDVREAWEANPEVKRFVRREFRYFKDRSGKRIVIEKAPDHSFRIPFIQAVFPEARWIHLLRDGRDVTLSIHKEWERRRRIVERRDYTLLYRVARTMIRRQPFWRHRLMALYYEGRHSAQLRPGAVFNKAKWRGQVGWGPRFEGWRDVLEKNSILRFNAYQWLKSVEGVQEGLSSVPNARAIEIRYEEFVTRPEEVLEGLFDFLGVSHPDGLTARLPPLKADNFNKWRREFTHEQIMDIGPVLTEKLMELGYEDDPRWFEKACAEAG